MIPGGTTELVWHFLGHLNLYDDIARDRLAYEDPAAPAPLDDYTTKRPSFDANHDLDEFSTQPLPQPEITLFDDKLHDKLHPLKSPHFPDPDSDFPLQGRLPPMPIPPVFGGGGSGGLPQHHEIKVVFEDGGEQGLIQVQQINFMSDNDMLLANDCQVPAALGHAALINFQAELLIEKMVDEAGAQIPKEWWIPKDNAGVTDFIQKFDQEQVDHGGAPGAHSVTIPGYYLNGELQPQDTAPPTTVLGDVTPHDTGHGLGLWADAGSNVSFNGALIVDMGESGRTMIVGGDYFHTNAIFQTNTIIDHDTVKAPDSASASITTGHDTSNNMADFVQHPGVYESLPVTFAGPEWHVDVVHGNFYSINTVEQTNYLMDNDVVVQQGGSNHYDVLSGGNEQGNLLQLFNGSIHYDLIVVEGAYHGMNVIFQNNVLLNNDNITLLAGDGAHPTQSVNSGGNELLNTATIDNYGNDKFAPTNDGLESIVSALRDGHTSLDPAMGNLVPGSGGTFDVLYVTGDYYDVNAIWQTNVTSDVNVIVQLMNAPSAAATQLHPGDHGTQSVNTGNDKLTNDAAIVDVGPTSAYVGGQVYGDSILVQANLVPTDSDHALVKDTHTLVPELIAFVGDTQHEETPAPAPVVTTPPHDDAIASVMH